MGQAGEPGCHSNQPPLPMNKGLLVWVQGQILLASSCPVFHLFSCFPARLAAQILGPRIMTFPRAVSNLLWGLFCINILYFLCWTNFPEGTSQFPTHFFFRDSIFSYSSKGLRMSLTKLPHLILETGEKFIKNIVLCMTEYCDTQSIQYFKSPKFHYCYAQCNIQKFSSVNIISIQLMQ